MHFSRQILSIVTLIPFALSSCKDKADSNPPKTDQGTNNPPTTTEVSVDPGDCYRLTTTLPKSLTGRPETTNERVCLGIGFARIPRTLESAIQTYADLCWPDVSINDGKLESSDETSATLKWMHVSGDVYQMIARFELKDDEIHIECSTTGVQIDPLPSAP